MYEIYEFEEVRLELTKDRKKYFTPLYEALTGYCYYETGRCFKKCMNWGEFDIIVTDCEVDFKEVCIYEAYGITPDGNKFKLTKNDLLSIQNQIGDSLVDIICKDKYFERIYDY